MTQFWYNQTMKTSQKKILLRSAIVLSIAWWIFIILQLFSYSTDGCTPDDELCNAGNTIIGDIGFGTLLAFLSIGLIWSISFCTYRLAKVLTLGKTSSVKS